MVMLKACLDTELQLIREGNQQMDYVENGPWVVVIFVWQYNTFFGSDILYKCIR